MRPAGLQSLPLGYTRLEYLESTGTQYIDSGVPYANDTCIETTFEITQFGDALNSALFGTENSENKNAVRFGVLIYSNYFRWDYGSQLENEYVSRSLNTKYKLKKDGSNNYIDGELVSSNAPAIFVSDKNGLIFTRITTHGYFIGKIYSFSISRAGVLQRNFIPTLDPNNRPCMFDTVSKKPFYNAATAGTDFLYG